MIWIALLLAQSGLSAQTAAPSQIERGQALFLETPAGCGTCHALKGQGTAVGPDLKVIARVSPAGIATAIRSTVTQYVQVAKVKSGGSFPTMPPAGDQGSVQIYDISKMPPEPHTVVRADISLTPNASWKHPPSTRKYTDDQLADIIAYLKYAALGSKVAVTPEEVK